MQSHELLPEIPAKPFTRRPRALCPTKARSQPSAEPLTPCPSGHRHFLNARTSPRAIPCQSQALLTPALANSSPLSLPSRCRVPPSPPVEGLMFPFFHLIQTSSPAHLPPEKSRPMPGPPDVPPECPHAPLRLCPPSEHLSHTSAQGTLSHAAQPTGQAPRPHPGPSHPSHCHHPQNRSPSPSTIVDSKPTTPPAGEPPTPPPALGAVSTPKPCSTCPPSDLCTPSCSGPRKAQRPGVPRKARGAPGASASPDPGLQETPPDPLTAPSPQPPSPAPHSRPKFLPGPELRSLPKNPSPHSSILSSASPQPSRPRPSTPATAPPRPPRPAPAPTSRTEAPSAMTISSLSLGVFTVTRMSAPPGPACPSPPGPGPGPPPPPPPLGSAIFAARRQPGPPAPQRAGSGATAPPRPAIAPPSGLEEQRQGGGGGVRTGVGRAGRAGWGWRPQGPTGAHNGRPLTGPIPAITEGSRLPRAPLCCRGPSRVPLPRRRGQGPGGTTTPGMLQARRHLVTAPPGPAPPPPRGAGGGHAAAQGPDAGAQPGQHRRRPEHAVSAGE